MKNVILLVMLTFTISAGLSNANAACISYGVAEQAVSGRTYAMKNSPDPAHPILLTFSGSNELTASYGSVLDGHPMGRYHYRGDCHGYIVVTFTSGLPPGAEPQQILHLRPTNANYFHLVAVDDNETQFSVVVDKGQTSGLRFHSSNAFAYKRYVWIPSEIDPEVRVCFDDKAGVVVADGFCSSFDGSTVSDLPVQIWRCQSPLVAGARVVTVAKDHFGLLSLEYLWPVTHVPDAKIAVFNGINFVEVNKGELNPVEIYSYSDLLDRLQSFQLRIHVTSEASGFGTFTFTSGRVSDTFDVTCKAN